MSAFEDSSFSLLYANQIGGQIDCTVYGKMGRIYGRHHQQQGSGVGSFLKGLLRRTVPLIKRGAVSAGKEAVRSGARLLEDEMAVHKRPIINAVLDQGLREDRGDGGGGGGGEVLKRRAEDMLNNFVDDNSNTNLEYRKKKRRTKKPHSSIDRGGGKILAKKKKKKDKQRRSARDIFEN